MQKKYPIFFFISFDKISILSFFDLGDFFEPDSENQNSDTQQPVG